MFIMETESKMQRECSAPLMEEYVGNNNKMMSIKNNSSNPKECVLTGANLTYRVMDANDINIGKDDYYFPINIKNCKFIQKKKGTVLKQMTISKIHRTIAPKLTEVNRVGIKNNICLESKLRKDDKRRETHNEVERRRRTKINNCIFKLKELIPEEEVSAELGKTSSIDSKSQILIRAYDYIRQMQEELMSLREYVKENDQLRTENQELHRKIEEFESRTSQKNM